MRVVFSRRCLIVVRFRQILKPGRGGSSPLECSLNFHVCTQMEVDRYTRAAFLFIVAQDKLGEGIKRATGKLVKSRTSDPVDFTRQRDFSLSLGTRNENDDWIRKFVCVAFRSLLSSRSG